jgi:tRNA threonylcarbamoyladenosine biosynthesis protein TsaB
MQADPLILALETATLGGSVCLTSGARLIASRAGDPGTSHSNTLLSDVEDLLREADVSISAVDLFTAAVGPGSFTGLRIGLATVKGLAATLGKSCVGVPTLEAVALASGESAVTVALLPAGRGEVFAQLFSVTVPSRVLPFDEPAHLSPAKLFDRYGAMGSVLWSGEGAHIHRQLIEQEAAARLHDWTIAPVEKNLSQFVAVLALDQYRANRLLTPDSLQAIYVRPSDAELNVVNK